MRSAGTCRHFNEVGTPERVSHPALTPADATGAAFVKLGYRHTTEARVWLSIEPGPPAGFRAILLIRRSEITPRWGLNRRRSGPRLGSKSLRYLNTLIEVGGRVPPRCRNTGDNQLYRARVLELRIHLPPARSQERRRRRVRAPNVHPYATGQATHTGRAGEPRCP